MTRSPHPDTFDKFVRRMPSGCWEWAGQINAKGYGRYRRRLAHRVSFERHKGEIPPGLFVCHTCDNRRCVNPDHLKLGAHVDNMRDMVERNRAYRWNGRRKGEANPNSKLTDAQVSEIRSLRGAVPHKELALRYGVSRHLIYVIQTGRLRA